jgi:hypothetical protein
MRLLVATTAVLLLTLGTFAGPSPALMIGGGCSIAAAQEQPVIPKAEIDIDVNRGEGNWWVSPTWLAIGGIALVLLIVIVAMVARGGGTTIVKE